VLQNIAERNIKVINGNLQILRDGKIVNDKSKVKIISICVSIEKKLSIVNFSSTHAES
jgi:hypothetical protein